MATSAARLPSAKLKAILANLNATPRLMLRNVKELKVSYAYRNDHWGARHFAKEFLPRIAYANPDVAINVQKELKTKYDAWRPDIKVVFGDGKTAAINMHAKWSTAIAKELMDVAGVDAWRKHKSSADAAGRPVFPGEENERSILSSPDETLPTLEEFRNSPEGKASLAKAAAERAEVRKKAMAAIEEKKARKTAQTAPAAATDQPPEDSQKTLAAKAASLFAPKA